MGNKFELRKDHSGLKYLFEQQNLNVKKTRWLEFRNEYEFDIKKNIKGKYNNVSYALIRRIHAVHVATISI
jgi:hypothetical protein